MGKLRLLLVGLLSICAFAQNQATGVNCTAVAVPPVVRTEGVTERLGDIVLNCLSVTRIAPLVGNLTIFLNTNITNRMASDNTVDVLLTADSGGGPVLLNVPARLASNTSVVFAGLNIPPAPSGMLTLRVSNLRGSANQFDPSGGQSITARLASNAGSLISLNRNTLAVGIPQRGLLASTVPMIVNCNVGSLLPDSVSFAGLVNAGTAVSTTRVSEGFADAFQKRAGMSDNGTRFILRFTSFPEGARLFSPNLIAGSSALQATRAGDFGGPASAGQYAASAQGTWCSAE